MKLVVLQCVDEFTRGDHTVSKHGLYVHNVLKDASFNHRCRVICFIAVFTASSYVRNPYASRAVAINTVPSLSSSFSHTPVACAVMYPASVSAAATQLALKRCEIHGGDCVVVSVERLIAVASCARER